MAVENVKDIKKVVCVGGGVIGSSWALYFASKGLETTLYDVNDEMLQKSREQMERSITSLVNDQALTEEEGKRILSVVKFTTDIEDAVKDAQFIQESGPERLEIKKSILANVEKYAPKDAVYASSTSGLLISKIAEDAKHSGKMYWRASIQPAASDSFG